MWKASNHPLTEHLSYDLHICFFFCSYVTSGMHHIYLFIFNKKKITKKCCTWLKTICIKCISLHALVRNVLLSVGPRTFLCSHRQYLALPKHLSDYWHICNVMMYTVIEAVKWLCSGALLCLSPTYCTLKVVLSEWHREK